jgi:hypothetical protein
MVQKARATGFECELYGSELEAGLQLLWQHLVHAPDGAKALAALRAQMDIDWALFENELADEAAAQG